jgi:hypothetical protein
VDQDDVRGRIVVEAALEELELARAADESVPIPILDPCAQRAASHGVLRTHRPEPIRRTPKA